MSNIQRRLEALRKDLHNLRDELMELGDGRLNSNRLAARRIDMILKDDQARIGTRM